VDYEGEKEGEGGREGGRKEEVEVCLGAQRVGKKGSKIQSNGNTFHKFIKSKISKNIPAFYRCVPGYPFFDI